MDSPQSQANDRDGEESSDSDSLDSDPLELMESSHSDYEPSSTEDSEAETKHKSCKKSSKQGPTDVDNTIKTEATQNEEVPSESSPRRRPRKRTIWTSQSDQSNGSGGGLLGNLPSDMPEVLRQKITQLIDRLQPTPLQYEKLRNLNIKVPYVHPNHRMIYRMVKSDIVGHIGMRTGPMDASEILQIEQNWLNFCKEYNLDPSQDFIPFLPVPFCYWKSPKRAVSPEQKIKFCQYLAQGLNDRHPTAVYVKFNNLKWFYRTGKFSPEEDTLIKTWYDYLPHDKIYACLSRILHRRKNNIYARLCALLGRKRLHKTDSSSKSTTSKAKMHILWALDDSDPDKYPKWALDDDFWVKAADESDVDPQTLKKHYLCRIYPYARRGTTSVPMKKTAVVVVNKMINLKPKSWDDPIWEELGKCNNVGTVAAYTFVREIVKKSVPKEYWFDLRAVCKILKKKLHRSSKKRDKAVVESDSKHQPCGSDEETKNGSVEGTNANPHISSDTSWQLKCSAVEDVSHESGGTVKKRKRKHANSDEKVGVEFGSITGNDEAAFPSDGLNSGNINEAKFDSSKELISERDTEMGQPITAGRDVKSPKRKRQRRNIDNNEANETQETGADTEMSLDKGWETISKTLEDIRILDDVPLNFMAGSPKRKKKSKRHNRSDEVLKTATEKDPLSSNVTDVIELVPKTDNAIERTADRTLRSSTNNSSCFEEEVEKSEFSPVRKSTRIDKRLDPERTDKCSSERRSKQDGQSTRDRERCEDADVTVDFLTNESAEFSKRWMSECETETGHPISDGDVIPHRRKKSRKSKDRKGNKADGTQETGTDTAKFVQSRIKGQEIGSKTKENIRISEDEPSSTKAESPKRKKKSKRHNRSEEIHKPATSEIDPLMSTSNLNDETIDEVPQTDNTIEGTGRTLRSLKNTSSSYTDEGEKSEFSPVRKSTRIDKQIDSEQTDKSSSEMRSSKHDSEKCEDADVTIDFVRTKSPGFSERLVSECETDTGRSRRKKSRKKLEITDNNEANESQETGANTEMSKLETIREPKEDSKIAEDEPSSTKAESPKKKKKSNQRNLSDEIHKAAEMDPPISTTNLTDGIEEDAIAEATIPKSPDQMMKSVRITRSCYADKENKDLVVGKSTRVVSGQRNQKKLGKSTYGEGAATKDTSADNEIQNPKSTDTVGVRSFIQTRSCNSLVDEAKNVTVGKSTAVQKEKKNTPEKVSRSRNGMKMEGNKLRERGSKLSPVKELEQNGKERSNVVRNDRTDHGEIIPEKMADSTDVGLRDMDITDVGDEATQRVGSLPTTDGISQRKNDHKEMQREGSLDQQENGGTFDNDSQGMSPVLFDNIETWLIEKYNKTMEDDDAFTDGTSASLEARRSMERQKTPDRETLPPNEPSPAKQNGGDSPREVNAKTVNDTKEPKGITTKSKKQKEKKQPEQTKLYPIFERRNTSGAKSQNTPPLPMRLRSKKAQKL